MRNLKLTISDLWHVSRTALAGGDTGRYERMQYVKRELNLRYPELIQGMSNKTVWLEIEKETTVF
jgi:hypothetical protein